MWNAKMLDPLEILALSSHHVSILLLNTKILNQNPKLYYQMGDETIYLCYQDFKIGKNRSQWSKGINLLSSHNK